MHKYLYDYYLKTLAPEKTEAFELHLLRCKKCQEEIARLDMVGHQVGLGVENARLYQEAIESKLKTPPVTVAKDTRPVPPDWGYVYNFADPDRPLALRLPPAGAGEQQLGAGDRGLHHLPCLLGFISIAFTGQTL